ncbi:toprim domain-containing protein [Ectopseudomonas mendocina]
MKIQNGACALTGSACLNKPELAFRDALQAAFGQLDWLPEPDGAIHRFRVPGDKPGALNGWYVLFIDGIASGAFGSWKEAGTWHNWSSRKPSDHLEADLIRQRIEHAKSQREAEQAQRQASAASYAKRLWREAEPAHPAHPYLATKHVGAFRLRQHGDLLLVPLYVDGRLCNLQRIASDGTKRFLSGGRVKGAYSPIGALEPELPLYVCEGWATGATIHAKTGAAVACAMNAGNLKPVAQALRLKHGSAIQIVIAGDDDRQTEGNPGRTAATVAAIAIGADVAFPEWPEGAPLDLSDFNDLQNWSADHE